MPLIGLLCPVCQVKAPLSHGWDGSCPDFPMPDYWWRKIVRDMQEDDVHVGLTLTPTTLLSCPRAVLITRLLPYYALPVHFDSASLGSGLHGAAESGARDLGYEVEPLIEAELDGLGAMKGRPDRVRGPVAVPNQYGGLDDLTSRITDLKMTNQGSLYNVRSRKDGLAKPEHCVQLSMYRLMYHKQRGILIEYGEVEYTCPLSGPERAKHGGSNWVRRPVKWLTLDEIKAHKPFEGVCTVQEHADILKAAKAEIEAGVPPTEVIAKMPLYGYHYIGGKGHWCKEYCEASPVCSGLGGGLAVLADWLQNVTFRDPEEVE